MLEALRRMFLRFGLHVRRITRVQDLNELIDFLSPAKCDDLIRVGSHNDGGYLLPSRSAKEIKHLYCAGVADDCNFELEFLRIGAGKKAFLADGSIDALPKTGENLSFIKKYIGTSTFDNWISFEDWAGPKSLSDPPRMLSMDIEGGEWSLFQNRFSDTWASFDLIIIELHGMHRAFDQTYFDLQIRPMITALSGFRAVHAHANNSGWIEKSRGFALPSLLEMTFLRVDRGGISRDQAALPNKLDSPNVPSKRDLTFKGFRYRSPKK